MKELFEFSYVFSNPFNNSRLTLTAIAPVNDVEYITEFSLYLKGEIYELPEGEYERLKKVLEVK